MISTSRQNLLIAVVVMAFTLPVWNASASETKPNIILLFIDDMGWADFSCFGNTNATTPNVDPDARGTGMTFTRRKQGFCLGSCRFRDGSEDVEAFEV